MGFFSLNKESRMKRLANNNIGIVQIEIGNLTTTYRNPFLDKLDAYYENRQYSGLTDWLECSKPGSDFVPVRKRKPLITYNFAKILSSRVSAKLFGQNSFPKFEVKEDPEAEAFFNTVVSVSKLQSQLLEPGRRMCVSGSVLIRFYLVNGAIRIEYFKSKYCWPKFQSNGELESVEIKYVFEDPNDKDEYGKPKRKWYRLDLGMMKDVLYDTPYYTEGEAEPEFKVTKEAVHELGFVQAEWFRTSEDKHSPDGYSLIQDSLSFIDEMNYNLSQSAQAIGYNQDPQLLIKNMDEEEIETLIRSSQKAWNAGKEGEASFLESNLSGVERASEFRDRVRLHIQDITQVILMDPEKMVGSAQSGKALEVLHGPFVDLINELRPQVEDQLQSIVLKMGITVLIMAKRGEPVPVTMPEGFQPGSLDLTVSWPSVFPTTMQDLLQKVQVASQAATANLISRETMTRWLSKDFDIVNIEEEIAKIAAQPVINPFGGF